MRFLKLIQPQKFMKFRTDNRIDIDCSGIQQGNLYLSTVINDGNLYITLQPYNEMCSLTWLFKKTQEKKERYVSNIKAKLSCEYLPYQHKFKDSTFVF